MWERPLGFPIRPPPYPADYWGLWVEQCWGGHFGPLLRSSKLEDLNHPLMTTSGESKLGLQPT